MDRQTSLAARAIAGDREALVAIVEEQHPRLRAIAARYVGRADDVDEVLQDVIVRAIERAGTVRDPQRLVPWLSTVTRHAAIDHLRRSRREAPSEHIDLDRHQAPARAFTDDVATRDFVHAALAELAPRDREALVLRDGYALGVDEVADRMSLTNGSARVMLVRARKRFAAAARAAAAAVIASFAPRIRRLIDDTHGGAVMTSGATAAVVAAVAVAPIATAQAADQLMDAPAVEVSEFASGARPVPAYLVELVEDGAGGLSVASVRQVSWATPTMGHRPEGLTSIAGLDRIDVPDVPDVPEVESAADITIIIGDEDGDHVRLDIDVPGNHDGTPAEDLPLRDILDHLPDQVRLDPNDALKVTLN